MPKGTRKLPFDSVAESRLGVKRGGIGNSTYIGKSGAMYDTPTKDMQAAKATPKRPKMNPMFKKP